jgi:similar to stage IV sporulation protein
MQGYVVIQVRGYSPERFINLCANKNIYIWNVRKISEGYVFCISGKAFFMLSPIAKKTKCRVKILEKVGLPFKFLRVKKRKYFFYGLLFSIASVILLSFFVWRIEIDGNLNYTNEEITAYLAQQNITIGSLKPKIKCSELDDQLLSHFNKTMWVSSELVGTKLIIHIREGVESEIIVDNKKPCDMIATKKGTVVSIITRTGTPLVKQGDEVEKDAILVSGTLEIKELTEIKAVEFTHSDADIFIRTKHPYSDTLEYQYIDKQYIKEKEKKDKAFQLFHFKINVLKPNMKAFRYDTVEKQTQIEPIKNFYLPIYFTTTTYMPFEEVEKVYSPEQAKEILTQRLILHMKKLEENNIQILSNDVIFKEDKKSFIASGSIYVIEKNGDIKFFDETIRRQEYNEYFTEEDGDTP